MSRMDVSVDTHRVRFEEYYRDKFSEYKVEHNRTPAKNMERKGKAYMYYLRGDPVVLTILINFQI